MNYILADDPDSRASFLPFAYTRPIAEMRIGIRTVREKWEAWTGTAFSVWPADYLAPKYPRIISEINTLVNSQLIPDDQIVNDINNISKGEAIYSGSTFLAGVFTDGEINGARGLSDLRPAKKKEVGRPVFFLNNCRDIFRLNGQALKSDFEKVTTGRTSEPMSPTNMWVGSHPLFIEKGARMECCIINTSEGPVYIGKDAEVMEGSLIRGPFALGEYGVLKMGTKIYGPTTIGPHSKVGGEVNNCVIFGYSNKAHDGFIGNSVIGEWCNLGADTNCSNLKNNYSSVRVWDYASRSYMDSGLQFCGIMMGDHAKCGINTMFNTGTVVGVAANIFGAGFPDKFIPSFAWGGAEGFTEFRLTEAIDLARRMYERRGLPFGEADKALFEQIHAQTAPERNF